MAWKYFYLTAAPSALAALLTSIGAGGCNSEPRDRLLDRHDEPGDGAGPSAGGIDDSFHHTPDLGAKRARDPFDILKDRQEEGPPELAARLHSCQKVQLEAIRSLLAGLGVALDAPEVPPSEGDPSPAQPAGALLREGPLTLGAADYDARVGERITWTTAGATKLFDIFAQAAPEIIANIGAAPLCQVDGSGPEMFDAQGRCNEDAVTCLLGAPATEAHLVACDQLVESATSVDFGKRLAVAALLSAAYSCE